MGVLLIRTDMSRLFITQSGIYKLIDETNGKVYVGSAVDLARRKSQHFSSLRKGLHPNPHLQNAYTKGHKIEFVIVELVSETKLLSVEQKHLDELWDNGALCYNVAREAARYSMPPRQYNVTLQSPDGKIYGPICGLCSFARAHSLDKENLSALISGKLKTLKGWRINDGKSKRPQSRRRKFSLVSPSGVKYTKITNITEFAEIHGLKCASLSKLVNGQRTSLFGWKLLGADRIG